MSKFAKQADKFGQDLGELFNRSIRQALLAGLVMAVRMTHHDSSNAAAHWMIAAKGKSRPGSRKTGKINDFRETRERAAVPPVGRRRDGGINRARTERFVRDRELRQVVDKLVKGRRPETIFYFAHPLEEGSEYYDNAKIGEAGRDAVQETARIFQNRLAAGQARKKPL